MKEAAWMQKAKQFLQKNGTLRLAFVLLLSGLALYLVCTQLEQTPAAPVTQEEKLPELQQQLRSILERMQGVGKAEVLLTLEQYEQTVYQTDDSESQTADSVNKHHNTVVVSGSGLVRTAFAPTYRGAVVVCEGADRAAVTLAVKQAVASLTGLRSEQITVLKMEH